MYVWKIGKNGWIRWECSMRRREGCTGAMTTDDAEHMVQGVRVGLGSRLICSIYSIRSYQMYVRKIGKNGWIRWEFCKRRGVKVFLAVSSGFLAGDVEPTIQPMTRKEHTTDPRNELLKFKLSANVQIATQRQHQLHLCHCQP